jgi:hypothetical protein
MVVPSRNGWTLSLITNVELNFEVHGGRARRADGGELGPRPAALDAVHLRGMTATLRRMAAGVVSAGQPR